MQVAKKNGGQLRTEAGQRNNNPDEKLLKEKPAENHTSAKRGFTEEVIQQRRLQDPSFPSVHRSIHLFSASLVGCFRQIIASLMGMGSLIALFLPYLIHWFKTLVDSLLVELKLIPSWVFQVIYWLIDPFNLHSFTHAFVSAFASRMLL
jgi:hypothetical protein